MNDRSRLRTTAFRTALVYFLVGAFWIFSSDYLLFQLIGSSSHLPVMQTLKGLAYMLITAGLLYLLVYRDLHNLSVSESSRRIREMEYKDLSDSIADLFYALDRDLRFTYWNRAMESLTGTPAVRVTGRHLFEIFPGTPGTIFEGKIRKVLETRRPHHFVAEYTLQGATRSFEVTASPSATGLSVLAKDITGRIEAERRMRETLAQVRKMLDGTVNVLALVTEKRDPAMLGHLQRSSRIATAIAREMGFSADRIESVRIAAILHDLGKISVPAELLSKPGMLSASEYHVVTVYPEVGYEILKTIDFPWPIAEIVRQHQEKYNGSGYPRALKGDRILTEARILRVADFIAARTMHRPYRTTVSLERTLEELENASGTLYDPEIVKVTLRLFREKAFTLEEAVPAAT